MFVEQVNKKKKLELRVVESNDLFKVMCLGSSRAEDKAQIS